MLIMLIMSSLPLLKQLRAKTKFLMYALISSIPYLYTSYGIGIPIYQGILTIFVVINFGLATFMDPGTYPRGNEFYLYREPRIEIECSE